MSTETLIVDNGVLGRFLVNALGGQSRIVERVGNLTAAMFESSLMPTEKLNAKAAELLVIRASLYE